ncbi:unnamed protein product [Thlaspi arvense]|uniref:Uncharacterized protein n=1 Tax=Thlaspi arvense TaxID=13288 RepID=A0AAU9SFN1_THLAR|nr:unnamed protein product [Thlaspi arvense]
MRQTRFVYYAPESQDHIFFECGYSWSVSSHISLRTEIDPQRSWVSSISTEDSWLFLVGKLFSISSGWSETIAFTGRSIVLSNNCENG